MQSTPPSSDQSATSRAGVRRTVWILAGCALASYLTFLLSVMVGK